MHRDEHVSVRISAEGLRRAARDNDLLTRSAKRREILMAWLLAIALGVFLGWSAAGGLTQ